MDYIKNLFKTFFKERKIPFFIGLGAAILSALTGILYISCLGGLDHKYINVLVIVLPILGCIAYLLGAFFKYAKAGAIAMTALDFASLIVFAITIYEYPLEQVMVISNIMDIPYMGSIIFIAILFVLSIVISNVVSYLPLEKESETKGE